MKPYLAVLYGTLLAAPAMFPQDGKVVVANSESKDLKRTAYRMRIPVERLKNARQALQEATDLAKRLRPLPTPMSSQLGNFWVMLHRARAATSINELVKALRLEALDAREPREYSNATSAAGQLLATLVQVDPEQAMEIARKWPEPSTSLGEAAQKSKSEMEKQFHRDAARRLAYNDPEAALILATNADGAENMDFGLRAQIAESMVRTGRREEAVKIIDHTISDLSSANKGQIAPTEVMELVQTLSRVTPDRFPEAFRVLIESADNMPAGGPPSVKIGDQIVALDNSEAVALNLLKDIYQRPALVMRAVDSMPALKSKLEPVGGIDRVLAEGPVEISYGNQGALETATYYGPDSMYGGAQGLYAHLRNKDEAAVRQDLSGMSASPKQINDLLSLAFSAAIEHPDLSSMALDQARKLVAQIEPVTARASLFVQMLRTSRRCDGEVDPELFKQGFVLVAQIRDQEQSQVKQERPKPVLGRSGADMLERALISELAIDDFDRAIRYVRTMPEGARLSGFLGLIEASRRPF